MKLTINLYAPLLFCTSIHPSTERAQRSNLALSWSREISTFLSSFQSGLGFEIINEKNHSEWVWLTMTGDGYESTGHRSSARTPSIPPTQDQEIIEWLDKKLPKILGIGIGNETDIIPMKFSGVMGKIYPVREK